MTRSESRRITQFRCPNLPEKLARAQVMAISDRITMMLEFLRTYRKAVFLDKPKYESRFPETKKRADFLLFENRVICEVKDVCVIDVPSQAERVWKERTPA